MQREIVAYLQKRKIPLKSRHIATKFKMDIVDVIPILRVMAASHIIKYKTAERSEKIDWAGWVPA
jgi:hypothetical protein